MSARLFHDIVIVCNKHFIPDYENAEYIYGVVQHVLHLSKLFVGANFRVSFVLYHRDDSLTSPYVYRTTILDRYPAAVLRYNINMPASNVTHGMYDAIMAASSAGKDWRATRLPLIYIQTDALLPFVPTGFKVIITHHSPFVDAVCSSLDEASARRAFEWDHPKMDFLREMQRRSIPILRQRPDVRCLEISNLQEQFLLKSSIPPGKMYRLPPPIGGFTHKVAPPPELMKVLQAPRDGSKLTVMTAVSRLDFFKNVDLFVDACIASMEREIVGNAIIIGGDADDVERTRLEHRVPSLLKPRFSFVKRLSRAAIVGNVFPALARSGGVFVCTSRYDLVPYTVLEASRCRLCTLIPDTGLVGASEYIPPKYQFDPDVASLVSLLHSLSTDSSYLYAFESTAMMVDILLSDETVMTAFINVLESF